MLRMNVRGQKRKSIGLLTAIALLGASLLGPGSIHAAAPDAANAAQTRNLEALRALLKQRIDVNATQPDGTTALHWAAHWNDVEAVNLLIGAGAKAATTNRFGASPLSEAATSGNA